MITQERLRELFDYRNGNLVWKVQLSNRAKIGGVAGNLRKDGYIRVSIDGKRHYLHRLIYIYHKGYNPEHQIDHINRNKSDNRIENLREITQSCNLRNKDLQTNNASGIKGIHFCRDRDRWVVQITINNKVCSLGRYKDLLEAACARLAVEQCLGWEGCDSSSPAYDYVSCHLSHAWDF